MAKEAKKVKAEDLKGKSPDELNTMLLSLRQEQMNLRFQRAAGQVENTARMRDVRRTIARVKTFLGMTTTTAAASPKRKAKA